MTAAQHGQHFTPKWELVPAVRLIGAKRHNGILVAVVWFWRSVVVRHCSAGEGAIRPVEHAQAAARLAHVVGDLVAQGFHAGKLDLRAQAVQELDFDFGLRRQREWHGFPRYW